MQQAAAMKDPSRRTILHADLNNFYASVECLHHPEMEGIPVAVCGDPDLRHGIVLAKNNLAKALGVTTGEPIWQARRKCGTLRVITPHFQEYLRFAQGVRAIYKRYTDFIEPFGLDEAWLDVTAAVPKYGSGKAIADEIRAAVRREMGITCSVGVANNKPFAKLGSDMKKPDATTVLLPSNYARTVWRLPASDLLYVGRATRQKLLNLGLYTIGDIAACEPSLLSSILGKWGETLYTYASGQDASPVARAGESDPIKSIGNSTTTPRDLTTEQEVKVTMQALAESVAARLREAGFKARTVQISIRDTTLNWVERQGPLPSPSCLSTELWQVGLRLFREAYTWGLPVRSIGIRATDLVSDAQATQLDLFNEQRRRSREEKLERTVDALRKRYSYFTIQRASQLSDRVLGEINPKDDHVAYPGGYSLAAAEVKKRGL